MARYKNGAAEDDRAGLREQMLAPPEPPTNNAPRLAPVYLRPLLIEASRVGVDARPWFRGLAFELGDLERPDFRVSHDEATTVVRRALRVLDNPRLGLELGERSRITHRGALALGLMSAPNLASSLALSLQYPLSAGLLLHVRAIETPASTALVAEPMSGSHDLGPFLVDKLFAGLVQQCRLVCDEDCAPSQVELMRPPPESAMAHEQHYRANVRFNSTINRLTFDARWLDRRLPMADPMCHRLSLDLLDRETAQSAGVPALSLTVARFIVSCLPRCPTQAEVATMLHMSERSLRRKLADEGASFRALLDDGRKARALDLISNSHRSMAEAAFDAGFGNARSLRRAIQRWTGIGRDEPGNDTSDASDDSGADPA